METLTNANPLTMKEAVTQIKELNRSTGKTWSFKANKGTVRLVCD